MFTGSSIRIVIADDYPIFRRGLIKSFDLKNCNSIKIVGEADHGENLIKEVERKKPDIVLTDVQMPVMNGADASRIINEKFPSTSIIALTMFNDADVIYKMFEAGAKGYLLKNSDIDEIIEAIETVYAGEMYYCSHISTGLIKKIGPSKYNHFKRNKNIHFTEKETQFIKLVCLELSIKEIADKMNISSRTVDEYSQNIKDKIEAKNLVGVALYAVRNGIVNLSDF